VRHYQNKLTHTQNAELRAQLSLLYEYLRYFYHKGGSRHHKASLERPTCIRALRMGEVRCCRGRGEGQKGNYSRSGLFHAVVKTILALVMQVMYLALSLLFCYLYVALH